MKGKLNFKYVPLTFIKEKSEIEKLIKNTVIMRYLYDRFKTAVTLDSMIEGTQYGYNASALEKGKNKFLRISDIKEGKVNWETVPYCNCKDEETYVLQKNDMLIARTGGTTGKSFLITNPPIHSIYAGYLIRIRAKGTVEPAFLELFLNSYTYWSQITSLNRGEFRPKVNANTLKSLLLPKCSIDIQKEVLSIINGEKLKGYENLYAKIERTLVAYRKTDLLEKEYKTQQTLLTQLRQAILQEAIQGKLTEQWRSQNSNQEHAQVLLDRIKAEKAALVKAKKIKKEKPLPPITAEEIPFELPKGWVWCRLGEVAYTILGKMLDKGKNKGDFKPYLRNLNVKWNKFDLSDIKKMRFEEHELSKYSVICGDVLICEGGYPGRAAIWNKEEPIMFQKALHRVRFISNPTYSVLFVNYLRLIDYNNKIKEYFTGSGIQHLTGRSLKNMPIPLPPLSEQQAIVQKVEQLLQQVSELETEVAQSQVYAEQLMQAVLKEAFE